jgi:hypothetical protein
MVGRTNRIVGAGRRHRVPLAVCAAVAALVMTGTNAVSSAATQLALTAPAHLTAFQLRLGDAKGATPTFAQTPSFAWDPVRGASRYDFQLAVSKGFAAGNGLLYESTTLRTPVASVPISLPWSTSQAPSLLYWRVRALDGTSTSPWSAPASFQVSLDAAPARLPSGPGYVRWSVSPGANGYDVWFVNLKKVVATPTTSVDLRDYFADGAPTTAIWRVRAERRSFGSDKRSVPVYSYGPWSAEYYTAVAPNTAPGLATLSPGASTRTQNPTHTLMPVFLFPSPDRTQYEHLYIATDSACTKVVYNSAIVRGGAFAPRSVQYTPSTGDEIGANSGPVFMQSGSRIRPTEDGSLRSTASAASATAFTEANVNLPAGKYYWTVVPVEKRSDNSYHDLKSPRSACAANKATFTKTVGTTAVANAGAPYATGLSPSGTLASATSTPGHFYGAPLVAWEGVPGATQYEVEWSHDGTKWHGARSAATYATSTSLPVGPGTWWYHVRVLDRSPAATAHWSAPAELEISTPTFSVVG